MDSIDNEKNIKLYKELVAKFGTDFKALNWGSQQSQHLRFKILCESIDINNKTILDIGCGLCDLYDYILKNNFKNVTYFGIDITDEMVISSQKRFPSINVMQGDITHAYRSFDCIFASGIFTYQSKEFLKEFIISAFNKTNCVLAFNALSSWTENKDEGELYVSPSEIFDFCKTITPWVTLRNDYHAGDFTIYMYKERNI